MAEMQPIGISVHRDAMEVASPDPTWRQFAPGKKLEVVFHVPDGYNLDSLDAITNVIIEHRAQRIVADVRV